MGVGAICACREEKPLPQTQPLAVAGPHRVSCGRHLAGWPQEARRATMSRGDHRRALGATGPVTAIPRRPPTLARGWWSSSTRRDEPDRGTRPTGWRARDTWRCSPISSGQEAAALPARNDAGRHATRQGPTFDDLDAARGWLERSDGLHGTDGGDRLLHGRRLRHAARPPSTGWPASSVNYGGRPPQHAVRFFRAAPVLSSPATAVGIGPSEARPIAWSR